MSGVLATSVKQRGYMVSSQSRRKVKKARSHTWLMGTMSCMQWIRVARNEKERCQWACPICKNSGRIMPSTDAIRSRIDLSEPFSDSRESPYPFADTSRELEPGPFSCIVCIATYLSRSQYLRIHLPKTKRLTRKCHRRRAIAFQCATEMQPDRR